MNKTVKIRFFGILGETFSKEYNLAVTSVSEAIHAINILTGRKLYSFLLDNDKKGIRYNILINGKKFKSSINIKNEEDLKKQETLNYLQNSELTIKNYSLKSIEFIPIIEGADGDLGGILTAVLGAVLIVVGILVPGAQLLAVVGIALLVGGIVNLLTRPPKFADFRDIATGGKASYLFAGPQNTVNEGGPVPVGYGELIVGSQVISASYFNKNISADSDFGFGNLSPGGLDTLFSSRGNKSLFSNWVLDLSFDYDGYVLVPGIIPILDHKDRSVGSRTGIYKVFDDKTFEALSDKINPRLVSGGAIYSFVKNSQVFRYGGEFFINNPSVSRLGVSGININILGNLTTTGFSQVVRKIIATRTTSRLFIGGDFTNYTPTTPNVSVATGRLTKLDYDMAIDGTFTAPNPNAGVYTILEQSDGKILVGGNFTNIASTARNRIARLNADGTIDATFDPGTGANGIVTDIKIDQNGKIMVAGYFTSFNSDTDHAYVVRLDSTGAIDSTFVTGGSYFTSGSTTRINTIAIQVLDGKILLGGYFDTVGGNNSRCLVRLNTDGSFDSSFNVGIGIGGPGLGREAEVSVIKVRDDFSLPIADGAIFVGGVFTTYNGVDVSMVIKLNNLDYINGSED